LGAVLFPSCSEGGSGDPAEERHQAAGIQVIIPEKDNISSLARTQ